VRTVFKLFRCLNLLLDHGPSDAALGADVHAVMPTGWSFFDQLAWQFFCIIASGGYFPWHRASPSVVRVQPLEHRRASRNGALADSIPHISTSVIIPAFNEEKVIASTVARILNSDYRDLEVIVVNDGSLDQTAEVIEKRFGRDPRVR